MKNKAAVAAYALGVVAAVIVILWMKASVGENDDSGYANLGGEDVGDPVLRSELSNALSRWESLARTSTLIEFTNSISKTDTNPEFTNSYWLSGRAVYLNGKLYILAYGSTNREQVIVGKWFFNPAMTKAVKVSLSDQRTKKAE